MRLLIFISILFLKFSAFAIDLKPNTINDNMNRNTGDRSQVQAAVLKNSFSCPACLKHERLRIEGQLGNFGLPASSRGAVAPGSNNNLNPATPGTPTTDSQGTTN